MITKERFVNAYLAHMKKHILQDIVVILVGGYIAMNAITFDHAIYHMKFSDQTAFQTEIEMRKESGEFLAKVTTLGRKAAYAVYNRALNSSP